MFCKNCNNYIDDSSVFCPYCNTKVGDMPHEENKKGGTPLLILGWIFFLIGVIGTVIFYLLYQDERKSAAKSWLSGKRSNYETMQFLMYICIVAAVLGVIMIIIGYILRASSGKKGSKDVIIIPSTTPVYNNIPQAAANQQDSPYDRLEKLKMLLDRGVITQEEFETKKQALLKEL